MNDNEIQEAEAAAIAALVKEVSGESESEPETQTKSAEVNSNLNVQAEQETLEPKDAPKTQTAQTDEQAAINAKTLEALQGILAQINANKGGGQASESAPLSPEQEQLRELGLEGLAAQMAQIQEAQKAQMAQIQEAQEAQRRAKVFGENLDKLKSDFPTIDPDDLGKWAGANGFSGFLGEDYNGWKLVAKAMINVATPTKTPDPITSGSGESAKPSAFDRLRKGENVDDLELGASILQLAGRR